MIVDRRTRIIEAATQSFSLYGYKGSTMDQIARLAHVGKGTIYRFFPTKEELLEAIMNRFIQDILEVAQSSVQPERTFTENLHRTLHNVLEFRSKHEMMVILSYEMREMGTEIVMSEMSKVEDALQHFVKEQVELAIDSGELQSCDAELTAFLFIKTYSALVVEWPKRAKAIHQDQIPHLLEFYLLNGAAQKGIARIG
ncbi:TetR/AcrR family transcriptional regulator [Paenibacillus popilliae]|uniref:TetR/AcrR family transcriptional regulator n=1 Tax=Paenibacillus popilliae TaxID=78057 RepID=A0ABY3AQ11_PAEPP|nr:TetR/AcrR family transcriptional regulator [Paenibacillus sp. SDF0028]TQR44077.1 TetR/AcrR family transcriptional regulator [Paenibacillus sp. SDF0028]